MRKEEEEEGRVGGWVREGESEKGGGGGESGRMGEGG